MKKTSTFLYSPQLTITVPFPNNDHVEILNSVILTKYSHFSQFHSSVLINEQTSFTSNYKNSCIVPVLPVSTNASTHLHESVNYNQPTNLQLIQVLCVAFFPRKRCLHSRFMSYKSMGLISNPTSSLLNLI